MIHTPKKPAFLEEREIQVGSEEGGRSKTRRMGREDNGNGGWGGEAGGEREQVSNANLLKDRSNVGR